MNYSTIKHNTIENGTGIRVSLFVSGCHIKCKGCHNSEIWEFSSGQPFTSDTFNEIVDSCMRDEIDGLTVLGGEPLAEQNADMVYFIISSFRAILPNKTVWLYTGKRLTLDEMYELYMLGVDVVVDSPFILEERDLSLKFKGSRNQRVIDLEETYWNEEVVLKEF